MPRTDSPPPSRIAGNALRLLGLLMIVLSVVLMASRAPDVPPHQLVSKYALPPSDFIEVEGQLVHYRDEGPRTDPVPLVLIHGTAASLHTWEPWVKALRSQRRVITFDLPGFGLTGPSVSGDYRDQTYARFTLALLDALQVRRFAIGGNSLGGEVAWRTALAAPDRAERLILIDSTGYEFKPESIPAGFVLASVPGIRSLSEHLLPRRLVEAGIRNVYGNPDRVDARLVDRYFLLTLREGNRRALVERLEQMRPGEAAHEIPRLRLPTLILWGEHDRLIPPLSAHRFAKDISGSQLVILPGLGHVPHEEDPRASLEPVLAFLGLPALEPSTKHAPLGKP
jgi:pimeloyl-ACP methyl ester carboxylesterase